MSKLEPTGLYFIVIVLLHCSLLLLHSTAVLAKMFPEFWVIVTIPVLYENAKKKLNRDDIVSLLSLP